MAGIGFVLRKMTRRDDLMGVAGAYFHAAMAAAGPWLFTVVALWSVLFTGHLYDFHPLLEEFRLIVIYNFCFSLVFTGPIYMVVTRYLADAIHDKDISNVAATMVGALILAIGIQLPIVVLFYGFIFDFDPAVRVLAIINYLLIASVWIVSIFVAALKDYNAITISFAIGMATAIILMPWFSDDYGVAGLVLAFNIGLMLIVFPITAMVFTQYPLSSNKFFDFIGHFRSYWELAASGFLYNAGIWVDKWVMWFAPERTLHRSGMISYPNYDSAMFLAYLFILPSLALFVFSVETSFFKRYLRYYRDILQHANLKRIYENHRRLIADIFGNTRGFIILQGSVCFLAFILAAKFFELFNINFMQMGMFRLGVLGTFFQIMAVFLMIVLSYFDNRKTVVILQAIFLLTNGVFSWISMKMGFPYYGLGFFLSALVTFAVAGLVALRHTGKLPFHSFITNNASVHKT